jgi:hypothetical protein
MIKTRHRKPASARKKKSHSITLSSASTLVVHLHALDRHSPLLRLAPGRAPKCSGVPELFGPSKASIAPWLVANTVLEEAIRATDSNVEDKIEFLIKWGITCSCLSPGIE